MYFKLGPDLQGAGPLALYDFHVKIRKFTSIFGVNQGFFGRKSVSFKRKGFTLRHDVPKRRASNRRAPGTFQKRHMVNLA